LLFQPSPAMRIRASTNHDTPLPPEEPAGENPPPGAIFYYYLRSPAQGEVKLEILDELGVVVRAYSSKDQPYRPALPPAFPMYWFHPAEPLSTAAGMHRFVWDIRFAPPPVFQPGYSMSTVAGRDVPREPEGPQAIPGSYQVRLTVDGTASTQQFKLAMDPRVKTSADDLRKQLIVSSAVASAMREANQVVEEIHAAAQAGKISAADEKRLAGARRGRGEAPPEGPPEQPAFAQVIANLSQLLINLDSADAAPTKQVEEAATRTIAQLDALLRQWQQLQLKIK